MRNHFQEILQPFLREALNKERHSLTIQEVLQKTVDLFRKKNISEPKLSAELLFAHALSCKRIDLYLHFDKPVQESELSVFRDFIRRRLKYEPVQYITGETDFFGLHFELTPSVLIPRPETEILVEKTLEHIRTKNITLRMLEIGVGSGNISVAIARNNPLPVIDACDLNRTILSVAEQNIIRQNLQERITLVEGDIFSGVLEKRGIRYDLIVSNPPYIALRDESELQPEIRLYEPRSALIDGEDGLRFYRKIAELHEILNDQGVIFVEIGFGQASQVSEIFKAYGCRVNSVFKDYSGIDRVVKGEW